MPNSERSMSHEENADSEARSMTLAAMVAALEEDIVLGRLHPRERLVEDELIARLGGTRHLVRQALMELDRIGLIDRIPNRGALVRSYTADEVEHLYVLRELLETKAASLIPLPWILLHWMSSRGDKPSMTLPFSRRIWPGFSVPIWPFIATCLGAATTRFFQELWKLLRSVPIACDFLF